MLAGVKPVAIMRKRAIQGALEEAVVRGELVRITKASFGFPEDEKREVEVVAQASKIEEGRELFASYFLDPTSSSRAEYAASIRRIGELLGYTENDTAWFLQSKYQNPLIRYLMASTMDLRAWARKECMLSAATEETKDMSLSAVTIAPENL